MTLPITAEEGKNIFLTLTMTRSNIPSIFKGIKNLKTKTMNVICIEERAFYTLLNKVIDYTKKRVEHESKWVTPVEAMKLLNIKSNTTLQGYRNGGKIRYSQPHKRVILYDRKSIDDFLERHAKETFY